MDMKNQLEQMDKDFHGDKMYDVLGKAGMTMADRINASRAVMCSGNMDQYVDPIDPEFPIIATATENLVGKNSTGYYKSDGDATVVRKISKFDNSPNSQYILVIYNTKTNEYDIVTRTHGKILTESFAYRYNNSKIDSLVEDDIVHDEEVLYKASAYDSHMNYRYGLNPLIMYGSDPGVIEDAIVMSESFANRFNSIEYDKVSISHNENDILLNLYGTKGGDYKTFPDIGCEVIDATICAKRRIDYSEILYSLKDLNNIANNDTCYYSTHCDTSVIVDINIMSNKPLDKIPDQPYYKQIRAYIKMQDAYMKDINKTLGDIISSGAKYSDDLAYEYSRSVKYLDPEYVWDHKGKVFGNIMIEIIVEKKIPTMVGSKMSARYGNKGVISVIRPDSEMPITENGERLDLILSPLSIVGRLNGAQTFEVELTFLMSQIILLRVIPANTYTEKYNILYQFSYMVNPDYAAEIEDFVNNISDDKFETFIDEISDSWLNMKVKPIGNTLRLSDIHDIYKKFDIEPIQVYVKKWGRMIPLKRKSVVGRMYFFKFKHHPAGKLSARSTGVISSKDLPIKSSNSKNSAIYSNTSIKLGEQESTNLLLNMDSAALSKMVMTHADSIMGRKDLCKTYETEIFPDEIELSPGATNRSSEVLRCMMKALGVGMRIVKDGVVDDF